MEDRTRTAERPLPVSVFPARYPAPMGTTLNILDVIEDQFGVPANEVDWVKVPASEIEALRDRILDFTREQAFTPAPEGTALLGGWIGAHWHEPQLRQELSDSLLYYPGLLVFDPLADFFSSRSALPSTRGIRELNMAGQVQMTLNSGATVWSRQTTWEEMRDKKDQVAQHLARVMNNLYAIQEPIRGGVITLRNQWAVMERTKTALETSVRHDVQSAVMFNLIEEGIRNRAMYPQWDNIRGLMLYGTGKTHPDDIPWRHQHTYFYLAKTLAVAAAGSAQYLPSDQEDLDLLIAKVNTVRDKAFPRQTLRTVSELFVPELTIPISEAVAVRQSSSDFEDWRTTLRKVNRDGAADTPEELAERISDEITPRIHAVEREISGSARLKAASKTAASGFVFAATTGVATVGMSGTTLGTAVGTAAVGGVVDWIRRMYKKPVLHGADAVLATLIKPSKP